MPGIDSYTKLLLHCNGTDGSTTFTDDSGTSKTVTSVGTAQIDTAVSKFGGASGLFDGDSDYVYTSSHTDFAMGTGDFTVDYWAKFASSSLQDIWWIAYSDGFGVRMNRAGQTNKMSLLMAGSTWFDISYTIDTTAWHHFAFVRTGTNLLVFIDGTKVLDTTSSANLVCNTDVLIGTGNYGSGYYFNGQLDEFRISKGIARWTSDFTPPTEAYSTDTPTYNSGLMIVF